MKKIKKLLSIFAVFSLTSMSLIGCSSDKAKIDTNENSDTASGKEATKIRLNEVTRSVFYAPMYVAIENGYFKDEGIEIDLSTGQGADKTMQALISGNADIGFSGPEQVLYVYNEEKEDHPVVIGKLTQKDGSFLVSKEKEENFDWNDLIGKDLIGGRPAGMPEMVLEYVLSQKEIKEKINLVTNIDFANVPAAFIGSDADYAALFEPSASVVASELNSNLVASVGKEAGNIPYTCFYASKSYIEKNGEIIEGFLRAIKKGQEFVKENNEEAIAKTIKKFFDGSDLEQIKTVVKNYKDIDAYAENLSVKEEELTRLMDIMDNYDEKLLTKRPEFLEVVDNSFADKLSK